MTLEELLIQFLIGACWADTPLRMWQRNVRMMFMNMAQLGGMPRQIPLKGGYL